MSKWTLGIIGGSGLYEIDGLEDRREESVETPWGPPSDTLVRGRIGEVELVFLPRHGRGHRLTPTEVPYRANIAALKAAGVTDILSISACGSLKEEYAPGHFLAADQFIDRTFARDKTFFGPGMVAHVSMAQPVCLRLSGLAADAAEAVGAVPRGTHHWDDFVTPEELTDLLADAGLTVTQTQGIAWRPGKGLHLSDDMSLNYILAARRA